MIAIIGLLIANKFNPPPSSVAELCSDSKSDIYYAAGSESNCNAMGEAIQVSGCDGQDCTRAFKVCAKYGVSLDEVCANIISEVASIQE